MPNSPARALAIASSASRSGPPKTSHAVSRRPGHGSLERATGTTNPRRVHTTKEKSMPLINVKVIAGVFTPDQKTEIAERLTDTMVSIGGENMRGVTWCVIEEVKSGDWAIGGQCLTTEAVHALAAGAPARYSLFLFGAHRGGTPTRHP